jgi:hypothetical protein
MRRARRLEAGLTQAATRRAGAERTHQCSGGSRRQWAPVSSGVGLGSCSTGKDGNGDTRPNLRGLRGCGPAHRGWWTAMTVEVSGGVPSFSVAVGGCEASREGAVEERTWHMGMDERNGVKKRDGRRPTPFMAARWHGREKGAGGSGVEGGQEASCGHVARGGTGGEGPAGR